MPSGREKIVHYWAAHVTERAVHRSTFRPNAEIAALEWVTIKRARGYLSYAPDREILDHFQLDIEPEQFHKPARHFTQRESVPHG